MSFWKFIGSLSISKWIYCNGRDLFLWLGISEHSGRQEFYIGKLKKKYNKKDVQNFLEKKGFEHDPYAWIDDGEVISMRKRVKEEYQYHVRLFDDREIRGHYEYAPDAKPLKHYYSHLFKPKKEYFHKLLKEFIEQV